eukprot:m.78854 g.78854  ORF g.78854 m.78854 type:complete len:1126 (+) comp11971_c0_seq3:136-3513(+)
MPFMKFRKTKKKLNKKEFLTHKRDKKSLATSLSTAKSQAASVGINLNSTIEGSADVTDKLMKGDVDVGSEKAFGIRNAGVPVKVRKNEQSNSMKHAPSELYQVVVEALFTSLGDTVEFSRLVSYAQFAFEICEDDHNRILMEAKKKTITRPRQLNILLERANNVIDKDTTGLSDPYCILQLFHDGEKIRHKVRAKKPVEHQLCKTNIISNTLNPVWHEEFSFIVDNPTICSLIIDVWDHDKGIHGSKFSLSNFKPERFLRDTYQILKKESDDFLGTVEVHCETIPVEEKTHTLTLQGRSRSSHVRGDLVFKTWWDAIAEKTATFSQVEIYRQVLYQFILYNTDAYNGNTSVAWDGILAKDAELILECLVIHLGLPQLQVLATKFRAFADYNLEERMSVNVLHLLLNDITKLQNSKKERNELCAEEEQALAEAIDNTIGGMYELIDRLFVDFEFDHHGQRALAGVIGFINCAFSNEQWKVKFGGGRSCKEELDAALAEAADEHIISLLKKSASGNDGYGDRIKGLVHAIESALDTVSNMSKVFCPVLRFVNVDLLSIIVKKWEPLLSSEIQTELKNFNDRDDHKTALEFGIVFRLYFIVKRMKDVFAEVVEQDLAKKLESVNMYNWFSDPIITWAKLASENSTQWIQKALKEDNLRPVGEGVLHSSSVLDTFKILNDLWEVWTHLDFSPDFDFYKPLLFLLTDVLGQAAQQYTTELFLDTKRKGFYDVEGRFDFSDSLCIVLNNLQEVILKYEDLSLEFLSTVQQNVPEAEENLRARSKSILSSLRESLKDTIAACTNKMRHDIMVAIVDAVFKSPLCKEAKKGVKVTEGDMENAAKDLLDYLNSNLLLLANNVYEETFKRTLKSLWIECCKCIIRIIAPDTNFKKKIDTFTSVQVGLLKLLISNLMNFFHQDGNGIEMNLMNTNDNYKTMEELLALITGNVSQKQLATRYYKQLARYFRHKYPSEVRGVLHVTVKKTSPTLLKLSVIAAHDLPVMDRDGKADGYIKIDTHPETKLVKTKVVYNSLDPEFNEEFEFRFSSEQEMYESVIHFVLLDKDALRSEYIGECLVELYELADSGFIDVEKRVFRSIPTSNLPHFNTLRVMQRRADSAANKFAKERLANTREH